MPLIQPVVGATPSQPALPASPRRPLRFALKAAIGLLFVAASLVLTLWLTLHWGILPRIEQWRPQIEERLRQLRSQVTGQPHTRNVERWGRLIGSGDVSGLRRILTGLDRDSIEMREVSPMGGLLSQEERQRVLAVR